MVVGWPTSTCLIAALMCTYCISNLGGGGWIYYKVVIYNKLQDKVVGITELDKIQINISLLSWKWPVVFANICCANKVDLLSSADPLIVFISCIIETIQWPRAANTFLMSLVWHEAQMWASDATVCGFVNVC
jgi:hypothetical protein